MEEDIPETCTIVQSYGERGGRLSREKSFGVDLLEGASEACMREEMFHQKFQFDSIFHALVNGDIDLRIIYRC